MKKLLALLMAVLMLVSFAACGGNNNEEETTTNPEVVTDAPVNSDGEEVTDAPEPENETEAEEVTEEGETEAEEATEEGETEAEEETKKEDKPSKEPATKKPAKEEGAKPVSQWSKQEILDYYNKAVVATDKKAPQGQSVMKLGNNGSITADGAIGGLLKVASPIIKSALERNSSPTTNIPGYGEIKMSDLKSIKATEKNGVITVEIVSKEQTDGPSADGSAGPVGRVLGTLGDIEGALKELSAEISRGRETVSLTYTDVTVKANIDAKTGIITSGTWHYLVNILVKDADIKISIISAAIKNLKAVVDYTVTF
ncbi:MAG: hypothetical protein IKL16_00300 [Clostridia bacterium]|nr:hypothetical protein [Clostridia bacterium]